MPVSCSLPQRIHRGALFHRGFLGQPQAANRFASSYEGPCLSCAPTLEASEAWNEIAKLGGSDLWSLRLKGGFRLIDGHEVLRWRGLPALARELGLIRPARLYRLTWHDCETGEDCNSVFADAAAAEAEMDDEERAKIESFDGWLATEALHSYWSSRHPGARVGEEGAMEAALTAIADLHMPEVHGVFWDDDFEPASLSAPRVAIFQRALNTCRRLKIAD